MVLKLEMILSIVSYEKKNIIIFYENYSKLTKNTTLNNLFRHRIFPYYPFLPILKKLLLLF